MNNLYKVDLDKDLFYNRKHIGAVTLLNTENPLI